VGLFEFRIRRAPLEISRNPCRFSLKTRFFPFFSKQRSQSPVDMLEHTDTYGQVQVCSKGSQGSSSMSAIFLYDHVPACTESATSEYSKMSQCLSALLALRE